MIIQGRLSTTTTEDGYRIVKALYMGDADVRTADEVSPWGIDSNPVAEGDYKNIITTYSDTTSMDDKLVMGYVYKGKVAAKGETRIFSTKTDGVASQYIWLKNNSTIEIGGSADNMVRFSNLKTAYDQLKSDHNGVVTDNNNLKTALTAFQAALTSAGGTPLTGTTLAGLVASALASYYGAPLSPSTGNIDPAKIDEIKTS